MTTDRSRKKASLFLNPDVLLGKECQIDPEVFLGYRTPRNISVRSLVIGERARIRSGTVIYEGSCIGDDLETGHHVIIREENKIGSRLRIWNHSIVDFGCHIGNNVKIHCHVYVAQHTVIEDDVFLAPGVMIANDLYATGIYSPEYIRGPKIKRGAKIGINVTLLPSVTIGEYSLIGAGSVVTKDIPSRSVAYGNPARVIKSIDKLPDAEQHLLGS